MKRLWHWLLHYLGCAPYSLVGIVHHNCYTHQTIETACCDWHAVLRCPECGEERTI